MAWREIILPFLLELSPGWPDETHEADATLTMDKRRQSPLGTFLIFLKLGCVSFGGPVAHLGFYQEEFVRKRRWLSDAEYADLVALCQFLPGPASSQVGFAIGYKQCGIAGAFAAWLGFTLPSAALMIGLALGLRLFSDIHEAGWITGLKLAAVAVVAQAIWSMAAKLCPDRERALVALGGAALLTVLADPVWQVAVIALGAATGWLYFRNRTASGEPSADAAEPRQVGWPWLLLFGGLLIGLPLSVGLLPGGWLEVAAGFYRAGALVFGGGHVVLPLLDAFTVGQGWVDRDTFLAGYGAAQAVPGPLFSFTGFLGAVISAGPGGIAGGILALVATYLPSWLLILGALPYWDRLRRLRGAQAALMGANAAVVGLLLAAFFDPVWSAAVTSPARLAFALVAFGALRFASVPPWALVIACALLGSILL